MGDPVYKPQQDSMPDLDETSERRNDDIGFAAPSSSSAPSPRIGKCNLKTAKFLDKVAKNAAKRATRELGFAVSCEYLGQRQGAAHDPPRYIREPAQWNVLAGERRSQQSSLRLEL